MAGLDAAALAQRASCCVLGQMIVLRARSDDRVRQTSLGLFSIATQRAAWRSRDIGGAIVLRMKPWRCHCPVALAACVIGGTLTCNSRSRAHHHLPRIFCAEFFLTAQRKNFELQCTIKSPQTSSTLDFEINCGEHPDMSY